MTDAADKLKELQGGAEELEKGHGNHLHADLR